MIEGSSIFHCMVVYFECAVPWTALRESSRGQDRTGQDSDVSSAVDLPPARTLKLDGTQLCFSLPDCLRFYGQDAVVNTLVFDERTMRYGKHGHVYGSNRDHGLKKDIHHPSRPCSRLDFRRGAAAT